MCLKGVDKFYMLNIRLLADTGVRVGQAVPSGRLRRRLKRFAEGAGPEDCRTDRLFVALRRPPGRSDYQPLTSSGVGPMLRALSWQDGITKWFYPHLLLYGHSSWAHGRSVDPITSAEIPGHISPLWGAGLNEDRWSGREGLSIDK